MASKPDFIPLARPSAGEAEIAALAEVIRSGWWTTGPTVTRFEEAVCRSLGEGLNAVAVNSCTAGLFLSLKAFGIGPGDQVIVPTWTFAATAQVVEWAGAEVVLCDIDPDTLNIDPAQAARLITPATRAIIPVHMAGYPCDMDPLLDLARTHGLHVIEDAAHAMGTRYKGKNVGTLGPVTVFSFYATKNLACGEGGMIVTPDEALAAKMRRLSYFGIDKEAWHRYPEREPWYYEIVELGYKFNMDSLHAAIGQVQLQGLDRMNTRRREIAAIYRRRLEGVDFFADDPAHLHSYHLFAVRLCADVRRDHVIAELRRCGIGSGVHYVPLHLHPHYQNGGIDPSAFPVATALSDRVLSLPLYPDLTDFQVAAICDTVNRTVGGNACH
ncbi:MAG: DegT/DnrJ/EryC1/StrS family aminotransferase [Desulfobacterales bacterium]|nr:DegT/DnrJ/EryC1/StrS family aminotransferase [Desulfobacterales bacterium]